MIHDPAQLLEVIEGLRRDVVKCEEFLMLPKVREWVIVGNLELDACFAKVSGELTGRFAYNFAGYGLWATFFGSIEQAQRLIVSERLANRYPTVFAMDRYAYVKSYLERTKKMLKEMEDCYETFQVKLNDD